MERFIVVCKQRITEIGAKYGWLEPANLAISHDSAEAAPIFQIKTVLFSICFFNCFFDFIEHPLFSLSEYHKDSFTEVDFIIRYQINHNVSYY